MSEGPMLARLGPWPIDYAALSREHMARFPKIRAALAELERREDGMKAADGVAAGGATLAAGSAERLALARGMLMAFDGGLAGLIGVMLEAQVPATDVMNILCEHLGRILSLVEPEQLRNSILGEIRRNLPMVLNRHVEARMRTPGGVIVPPPGARVQ